MAKKDKKQLIYMVDEKEIRIDIHIYAAHRYRASRFRDNVINAQANQSFVAVSVIALSLRERSAREEMGEIGTEPREADFPRVDIKFALNKKSQERVGLTMQGINAQISQPWNLFRAYE